MEPSEGERIAADAPTVAPDLLSDFLAVRKAKRAGPLTKTALAGLQREASKAGLSLSDAIAYCCEVGWQSFNASWYADRQTQGRPGRGARGDGGGETPYQRNMRERVAEVAPSIARGAPAEQRPAREYFQAIDVPSRVVPV